MSRFMGKVIRLEEWSEDRKAERFENLTAIGYGEPAFAAYYPDCRTVFGFHDTTLEADGFDAETGKISYSVIGWYSDENADPVHMAGRKKELNKLLSHFNWELPDCDDDGDMHLLCNGFIYDVKWKPDMPLLRNTFDPNEISVSIGNTAAEGLATLLKNCNNYDYDGSEKLLEGLQTNQLDQLDRLDSLADLEKALHRGTFSSEPAGIKWMIESNDTVSEQSPRKKGDLMGDFVEPLNTLNSLQADLNQTEEKIEALRRQIFADWYKFMICKYEKGIRRELDEWGIGVNDIRQFAIRSITTDKAEDLTDEAKRNHNNLDELIAHREAVRLKINEMTGKTGLFQKLPPGLTLEKADAPNYFFPNEPVLTIASKDLKSSYQKYGQRRRVHKQDFLEVTDDFGGLWDHLVENRCIDANGLVLANIIPLETPSQISLQGQYLDKQEKVFHVLKNAVEGILACRNENRLVSAITFRAAGEKRFVNCDQMPSFPQTSGLPDCTNRLLAELFFFAPCHAPYAIARAAASGNNNHYAAFRDEIEKQQNNDVAFYKNCLQSGVLPPKISTNKWKRPWHPLFLHWEVRYWPLEKIESKITEKDVETRTTFKKDLITSNFVLLEDGLELGQKKARFAELDQPAYSGISALTPHALQNLRDLAAKFLQKNKNEPIRSVLKSAADMHVLSQAITGFNERLLTFNSRLQFPIYDPPERDTKKYQPFTEDVFEAVAGMNTASPATNANFNPIRAGYMRISKIRIVDAFGQHKEIADPPVFVSRSFVPQKPVQEELQKKYGNIYLPPRIVQPNRLKFYWIQENKEISKETDLPESPICGWIVANFLDHSLMIFDKDGESLGAVRTSDKGCVFRVNPGENESDMAPGEGQIKNRYLKEFVQNFRAKKDQEYLRKFIGTIQKGLDFTHPDRTEDTSILSLIVGRPIALARAALNLDLKGFAAANQGWNSFVWDLGKNNCDINKRDTSEFDAVDFPVRFGCSENNNEYNDGLIGYFRESAFQTDFGTFYSAYADENNNGILKPKNLALNCRREKDGSDPLTCLLLLDPMGKIHATSGVLPKQHIELSGEYYDEAFKSMTFSFLTSPLLVDSAIQKPEEKDDGARGNEKKIHLPTPAVQGSKWTWVNRIGKNWEPPLVVDGAPPIKPALPQDQHIVEGWLKLSKGENHAETEESPGTEDRSDG